MTRILTLVLALGLSGVRLLDPALAQRQVTPPAPACTAETRPTPSQTEGPFYRANSPQRTSLVEQGMGGARIIITGYVLTRGCRP